MSKYPDNCPICKEDTDNCFCDLQEFWQRIAELEAQLAEQRPYLRHKRSCAKTDSWRIATYCTCGLQTILEKGDG